MNDWWNRKVEYLMNSYDDINLLGEYDRLYYRRKYYCKRS